MIYVRLPLWRKSIRLVTCSEKYQCSAVNRPEGDVIGEKRGVSTFSPNFEESKGNEEGLSEEHPVRRGVTSEERL